MIKPQNFWRLLIRKHLMPLSKVVKQILGPTATAQLNRYIKFRSLKNGQIIDNPSTQNKTGSDSLIYRQGIEVKKASGTWYRGKGANFIATKANLKEKNAIEQYILKGWIPNKPFINKADAITTFGSCFAAHITNFLKDHGYNVAGSKKKENSYIIRCGEGMVNTFAILQQFEWAYENKQFSENLWFDSKGLMQEYLSDVKESTKKNFLDTKVFIITLGLSEIWYNKKNGDAFWRAIPREKFDPECHGFKVSSVEENKRNLEKIFKLIRTHRKDATIIFTLSPVPLVATFRDKSCITANSVSKAILRAAVDEFLRYHEQDKKLFYFPSYELVNHFFDNPYENDNRHIKPNVVKQLMDLFAKYYLHNE